MEVEENEGEVGRISRKRTSSSVWEVEDLRASLEADRNSPFFLLKRLKHRPFIIVKTVSGTLIRVEPFMEEGREIRVKDIKRCLSEEHGINIQSTCLIYERRNVTEMEEFQLESGVIIYAVLKIEGCQPASKFTEVREY